MTVLRLYATFEDIEWDLYTGDGILQIRDNIYIDIARDDNFYVSTLYIDEHAIEHNFCNEEDIKDLKMWIIELQKDLYKSK